MLFRSLKTRSILLLNGTANMNDCIPLRNHRDFIEEQRPPFFQIAIPLDSDFSNVGKLFAFLPTEISTEMPVDINGMFFPVTSRKTIKFSDNDFDLEAVWNSFLFKSAALFFAQQSTKILEQVGNVTFIQLLEKFRILHQNTPKNSNGLNIAKRSFWEAISGEAMNLKFIESHTGELISPRQSVVLTREATKYRTEISNWIPNLVSDEIGRAHV